MKVHELIELLQEQNPDAEVYFASQPDWPFEYTISGGTDRRALEEERAREEWYEMDPEDRAEFGTFDEWVEQYEPRSNLSMSAPDAALDDVILVEGTQARYGDRNAWNLAWS